MFKTFASVVMITALVCMLGGTSVFARNTNSPDDKNEKANVPADAPPKDEPKANEQLKKNIHKLVADAKAGKIAPAAKSQIQPAKGNNLSTKTKIAIGVGVAVLVLALVANHVRNHLFDDFHPFRQGGN